MCLDSVCGQGGWPTAEHVLWYHVSVVWLTHSCFLVPTYMDYTRMCDWGWWGHCVGRGGVETWGCGEFGLCVWAGRVAHGRARVVVPRQCVVADPLLFSGTHMHGLHAHV